MIDRSIDRVLALADDPPARPRGTAEDEDHRLLSFGRALALTALVELLARELLVERSVSAGKDVAYGLLTLGLAGLTLRLLMPRPPRWLWAGLAAGLALSAGIALPATANHTFLMTLCFVLFAVVGLEGPNERRLLLVGLRWLWVLVFFTSGVQKVVYGLYGRGQTLAYLIATENSFSEFFGWLMPASEVGRLQELAGTEGPFLSPWAPLVAMSLAVVLGELILPWLLLWRQTRRSAILATVLLIVGIELGAREIFFGAAALLLTLLFARRDLVRPMLPALAIGFTFLLAARRWWPGFEFF